MCGLKEARNGFRAGFSPTMSGISFGGFRRSILGIAISLRNKQAKYRSINQPQSNRWSSPARWRRIT
jgi:hypothetical protein